MAKIRATDEAHKLLAKHIQSGDIVIDATIGNGYDTCFLAELTGATGTVFGFDIQQQASENTHHLYKAQKRKAKLTLFTEGHEFMCKLIPEKLQGKISAITFNLGYLPKGDKTLTTTKRTTLTALHDSLLLIRPNGIITILAYRGHSGGEDEYQAIMEWFKLLPAEEFTTHRISPENAGGPVLFAVIRHAMN